VLLYDSWVNIYFNEIIYECEKGNMMKSNIKFIFSTFIIAAIMSSTISLATSVKAQSQDKSLLSSLKSGLWKFRDRARGNELVDAICVGDVKRIVQIKNKDDICTHKMLRSSNNTVTYKYICNGKGNGTTTIRKETNGLVQIESQGITDGQLFNFKLEARHSGSCRN